jgi:hypothetical protein
MVHRSCYQGKPDMSQYCASQIDYSYASALSHLRFNNIWTSRHHLQLDAPFLVNDNSDFKYWSSRNLSCWRSRSYNWNFKIFLCLLVTFWLNRDELMGNVVRKFSTERRGRVVETPALYFRCRPTVFKSRHGGWLLWLRFSWISSVPPDECQHCTSKLGHNRFLPNRFHFVIHLLHFHSTQKSLSY